jgi:hypothetical protein
VYFWIWLVKINKAAGTKNSVPAVLLIGLF